MIKPDSLLRQARRKAGFTQRALARAAHVPQPTIAALESGRQDPRFETLGRLLHACGFELDLTPVLGRGVDRTQIRARLALTPHERVRRAVREARVLRRLGRMRVR